MCSLGVMWAFFNSLYADCDILIQDDTSISRRHAVIRVCGRMEVCREGPGYIMEVLGGASSYEGGAHSY